MLSFIRKGFSVDEMVFIVCNFSSVAHLNYCAGVPFGGFWKELLNSDAKDYGGSELGNLGGIEAKAVSGHGRPYSLNLALPPLSAVLYENERRSF